MPTVTYREANRRYRRAFWIVIVFYSVMCFGGPLLLKQLDDPPKWAWGIAAFMAGAPIAGVFWLMGRLLRETDEYTRKLKSEALLAAGGLTLSFAGVWGFLDIYEVTGPLWSFWLVPMFFGCFGIWTLIQNLRGQRGDGC